MKSQKESMRLEEAGLGGDVLEEDEGAGTIASRATWAATSKDDL